MNGRGGVTVLEVMVILAIGTVLAGVLGGSAGGLQGRMALRSAESRLLALHRQAASHAMEKAIPVRLAADPGTQTVTIQEGCHGEGAVVDSRDFNLSYRVDMLTSGGVVEICLTPRGYADPALNSFTRYGTITFLRGEHSTSVIFFPLGQVARQ